MRLASWPETPRSMDGWPQMRAVANAQGFDRGAASLSRTQVLEKNRYSLMHNFGFESIMPPAGSFPPADSGLVDSQVRVRFRGVFPLSSGICELGPVGPLPIESAGSGIAGRVSAPGGAETRFFSCLPARRGSRDRTRSGGPGESTGRSASAVQNRAWRPDRYCTRALSKGMLVSSGT